MDMFGLGLALVAAGVGVYASVKRMTSKERKSWINISKFLGIVGLLMIVYSFVSKGSEAENTKNIPSINQTITNSSGAINALGDVTVNQEQPPWELTENQKKNLSAALKKNKVPPGTTYQLRIHIPDRCERCAGYATDLAETWREISGWEVRSAGNYGLDVRLQGVFVAVDMEGCPPEELLLVKNALEEAEIKYTKVKTEGNTGAGACGVIVGNRPQG